MAWNSELIQGYAPPQIQGTAGTVEGAEQTGEIAAVLEVELGLNLRVGKERLQRGHHLRIALITITMRIGCGDRGSTRKVIMAWQRLWHYEIALVDRQKDKNRVMKAMWRWLYRNTMAVYRGRQGIFWGGKL